MILAAKSALVTGGGRGIGRAISLALAEAGANVAVNDISPELAAEVTDEIRARGRDALAVVGDVTQQSEVERLVRQTAQHFGRLDIAVSNAAYSDREFFYEADMQGFQRTVDVTMWGALYLVRAVAQQMMQQTPTAGSQERGSIVVIGSPHALIAVPTAMAYNMAKAAVDQMARTAAIELVDHRIRVNIIHPGWTDTPGERKFASETELQQTAAGLPWGRMARPDEIARGVVFLSDPASEYITGSTLVIDGGLSLPWWENRGSQTKS